MILRRTGFVIWVAVLLVLQVVWVVGEVCPAHCDPTRLFVAGQDCTEHGLCCGYPNNLYCCTDYWDRPRAPLPDIRTEADCRPSENAAPSTLPTSNLLATGSLLLGLRNLLRFS